jgi:hypothetical protein
MNVAALLTAAPGVGKISRFAGGDTVDFVGAWSLLSFSENASHTMATLTLADGATHHAFTFRGAYAASDFHIATGATTTITHA